MANGVPDTTHLDNMTREGLDQMGNMLVDLFDKGMTAATEKGTELAVKAGNKAAARGADMVRPQGEGSPTPEALGVRKARELEQMQGLSRTPVEQSVPAAALESARSHGQRATAMEAEAPSQDPFQITGALAVTAPAQAKTRGMALGM
jgi:hypothetical protein